MVLNFLQYWYIRWLNAKDLGLLWNYFKYDSKLVHFIHTHAHAYDIYELLVLYKTYELLALSEIDSNHLPDGKF